MLLRGGCSIFYSKTRTPGRGSRVISYFIKGRGNEPEQQWHMGDLIRRFFAIDIPDIGIYERPISYAPLEADFYCRPYPSINESSKKALAEEVDEAARQYISGPLREQLLEGNCRGRGRDRPEGSFFLSGSVFDAYRNKDALDILVVGYDGAFGSGDGYVQAAVRIEGGARPDPVPVEQREIAPYVADELPNRS